MAELQRWYAAQCDGDWEHAGGVRIGTLDNPGWSLTIELAATALAGAAFEPVSRTAEERGWVVARVQADRFEAFGGPHMLGTMIQLLLNWARASQQRTT